MLKRDEVRVFLSAGETSGDHYGAELIGRLREALPGARFGGLGGLLMEGAGQQRTVRAEAVAVMGITEIVRHVPRIYASYRRLVRTIRRERPDVAILIDFPDVNFRLAKHLRRAGVPVVWFVSPQLWAWKRRRLRWVQQRVDRMVVIFPFEETFYRARGVEARFAGHPLATRPREAASREVYAAEHGLDAAAWWVGLLPGSRWRELELNLPEMLRGAGRLREQYGARVQFVLPVASGLEVDAVRGLVDGAADGVEVRVVRDAAALLPLARASVVGSGTATVLAAVSGQPFVVVYRVSALTYAMARRLVRYPEEIPAERDAAGNLPVAMVNLLAGRRVVPELLNDHFTAETVADEVSRLLEEGEARERQMQALREVRERLQGDGVDPVEAVAGEVLSLLEERGRVERGPAEA